MRDRQGDGDLQDRDTSVGREQEESGARGEGVGRAAAPSEDGALGLAGAPEGLGDAPGSGRETGNASLGSGGNAAQRVDTFNTPKSDR